MSDQPSEPEIVEPEIVEPDATTRPDQGPPERRIPSPFSLMTLTILFLVAVVAGYLFVGTDVLVLAVALLVLLRFGRDPARPLALAAFALLVIAGIASIVQDNPSVVNLAYSSRRPVAAEAGAIIGVFLVLATLIFSVTERASTAAPPRPLWRHLTAEQLQSIREFVPAWLRFWAPYGAVLVVATAVRVVAAPRPLAAAYDPLITNLRLGTGYSAAPPGAVPAGEFPPLATGVAAYFPYGPKLALFAASLATVAVVAWLAERWWGRRASLCAAGFAAVLPAMWDQQLPVTLAQLFLVIGVAVADPVRANPRRAALAGFTVGLAVLARPDALIAAAVVLAWIAVVARRRASLVFCFLFVFVVTVAPWCNFVWSQFGLPWPMATLAATLNDPTATSRLPGIVGFAVGIVVLLGVVVARRRERGTTAAVWFPLLLLPVACLLLSFTDFPARDPLSWSAPMAALALGYGLAAFLGERFPLSDVAHPVLALDEDVVDAAAVIDPEPEDERLFW